MASRRTAVFLVFMLSSVHGQSLMDILFGPGEGTGGGGGSSSSNTINSNISPPSNSKRQSVSQSSRTGVRFFDTSVLSGGAGGSDGLGNPSSFSNSGSNTLSSTSNAGSAVLNLDPSPSPSTSNRFNLDPSSSSGGLQGVPRSLTGPEGFCTPQEKRLLFNNCARSFGMAHMRHFRRMSKRPTCDTSVFECSQVDTLIRCVNSQPVRQVSNRCWPVVDQALTGFMHEYRVPCGYEDLKNKCHHTAQGLLPVGSRPVHGQGMNTDFMAMLRPTIQRRVMMMMMMMGGGALFGM